MKDLHAAPKLLSLHTTYVSGFSPCQLGVPKEKGLKEGEREGEGSRPVRGERELRVAFMLASAGGMLPKQAGTGEVHSDGGNGAQRRGQDGSGGVV